MYRNPLPKLPGQKRYLREKEKRTIMSNSRPLMCHPAIRPKTKSNGVDMLSSDTFVKNADQDRSISAPKARSPASFLMTALSKENQGSSRNDGTAV